MKVIYLANTCWISARLISAISGLTLLQRIHMGDCVAWQASAAGTVNGEKGATGDG